MQNLDLISEWSYDSCIYKIYNILSEEGCGESLSLLHDYIIDGGFFA